MGIVKRGRQISDLKKVVATQPGTQTPEQRELRKLHKAQRRAKQAAEPTRRVIGEQ